MLKRYEKQATTLKMQFTHFRILFYVQIFRELEVNIMRREERCEEGKREERCEGTREEKRDEKARAKRREMRKAR